MAARKISSSEEKKWSHPWDTPTAAAVPTSSAAASTAAAPRFIQGLRRRFSASGACSASRASVRADFPAAVYRTRSNSL